jgi:hypothetical protein
MGNEHMAQMKHELRSKKRKEKTHQPVKTPNYQDFIVYVEKYRSTPGFKSIQQHLEFGHVDESLVLKCCYFFNAGVMICTFGEGRLTNAFHHQSSVP